MAGKTIDMKAVVALVALGFFTWVVPSWAYTVNDNTLVGRGTTNATETGFYWGWDHVDEAPSLSTGSYNIFGIDMAFSSGHMKISIYSNFNGSDHAGNVAITPADLGLDLNRDGRYEYGVALTARESGIVAGQLYKNVSWNTSKYYLENKTGTNYYYGEMWGDATHNTTHNGQNPIVHIASGTALGNVELGTPLPTALGGYPAYLYDLTIPVSLFDVSLQGQIGIFWGGSTCANDIIEGTAPVPVPTSILLLFSGLLGMLVIARRKSSLGQ